MSAGCAGCGACCDPVVLDQRFYDRALAVAEADRSRDQQFIALFWHPLETYGSDGVTWLRLRCDMFDPLTRRCVAYEDRPPACSRYPWYESGPNAADALFMSPQCSFLADLPPDQRPAGARPLIPLMVTGQ